MAETLRSTIIASDTALKLVARNAFTDRNGSARKAGEEWLIRESGAYLPDVNEQVVSIVRPQFLKQTVALHLRATDTFTGYFFTFAIFYYVRYRFSFVSQMSTTLAARPVRSGS